MKKTLLILILSVVLLAGCNSKNVSSKGAAGCTEFSSVLNLYNNVVKNPNKFLLPMFMKSQKCIFLQKGIKVTLLKEETISETKGSLIELDSGHQVWTYSSFLK